MPRTVAIHQPNFFPWLGFFDKIVRSDAFILLDDVQFSKKGGTWSNRVKLLVNREAHWVTACIVRNYHGFRAINEMEFQSAEPWREKVLKTISISYAKAPRFQEAWDFFEPLIQNPENNVAAYNAHAILAIAARLEIPRGKFHLSSKLPHEGTANQLLISLTKAVRGDSYMCGGGADGYQEDAQFPQAGIDLIYQNFRHPVYPQTGAREFVPGLSLIDAVANCGFEGVRDILSGSRRNCDPCESIRYDGDQD
jgi:hypothetical protein